MTVVQFKPNSAADGQANLSELIRLAREELVAFETAGAWTSDRWQSGKTVVVFATKTEFLDPYSFTPMAEPFKQFAKAYVRYDFSLKPIGNLNPLVQALRCIEAALLMAFSRADIMLTNGAVMDLSAQFCREFYSSPGVHCNTGRKLQNIFDFLRTNQIIPNLPLWKSPFKKPKILTEDIGAKGEAYRSSKMPSNHTMLMVADLFAQAETNEARFYSSVLILMMAAPSRISEVLSLSTDCIQWEDDNKDTPQMFLRWRAAKGKGATKKWVLPAMHDAVQEAVKRLTEIGQPARDAALFAYNNPGRFMRHPGCLADPDDDPDRALDPTEFFAAIGVRCTSNSVCNDGTPNWSRYNLAKHLNVLIANNHTSYSHLANFVLKEYAGLSWPHVDNSSKVEIWNALCLHRANEFHKEFVVRPFSWRLPTTNDVNSRISSGQGRSLFEQFGITDVDGSNIKLTTHQLRHWLSTMSERAGMDDFTLAQWAGRARTSDNRHYDHRSADEKMEMAMSVLRTETPPLTQRVVNRQPVTYQELGVERLGTAKATLYGMCVHDYAMAPCQKLRECMTCTEHVCIKGDHISLERILLLEAQTELLLARAQDAHEDGDFGADRWVDNHKWKLAHVRSMRLALERPDLLPGTILRIPDGHDPSPVRRALMDLGVVGGPSGHEASADILPSCR